MNKDLYEGRGEPSTLTDGQLGVSSQTISAVKGDTQRFKNGLETNITIQEEFEEMAITEKTNMLNYESSVQNNNPTPDSNPEAQNGHESDSNPEAQNGQESDGLVSLSLHQEAEESETLNPTKKRKCFDQLRTLSFLLTLMCAIFGTLYGFVSVSENCGILCDTSNLIFAVSNNRLVAAMMPCFGQGGCWVKYNFLSKDSYSTCNGTRFVRMSTLETKILGIVLCDENGHRYKLYLSVGLLDYFYDVGTVEDDSRQHCYLLYYGWRPNNSTFVPDPIAINSGFYHLPQRISFLEEITDENSTILTYPWYECGVKIPGTQTVYNHTEIGIKTEPKPPPVIPRGVSFGQILFEKPDTFIVPSDVTVLDVICIGGGGTGNTAGGDSKFGDYLYAQGGQKDKGGWGLTASGGDGKANCSGGGAAGETYYFEDKEFQSFSDYPYCGIGLVTKCYYEESQIYDSSEQECFGFMYCYKPRYGGGSGGNYTTRAGGGGGYSRAAITVTPGEKIEVIPGSSVSGQASPGVVIVAWGGNI